MRQIKNFMEAKRPMWNCNECKCITMQCWKESEAFCGCGEGGSPLSPLHNVIELTGDNTAKVLINGEENYIEISVEVDPETGDGRVVVDVEGIFADEKYVIQGVNGWLNIFEGMDWERALTMIENYTEFPSDVFEALESFYKNPTETNLEAAYETLGNWSPLNNIIDQTSENSADVLFDGLGNVVGVAIESDAETGDDKVVIGAEGIFADEKYISEGENLWESLFGSMDVPAVKNMIRGYTEFPSNVFEALEDFYENPTAANYEAAEEALTNWLPLLPLQNTIEATSETSANILTDLEESYLDISIGMDPETGDTRIEVTPYGIFTHERYTIDDYNGWRDIFTSFNVELLQYIIENWEKLPPDLFALLEAYYQTPTEANEQAAYEAVMGWRPTIHNKALGNPEGGTQMFVGPDLFDGSYIEISIDHDQEDPQVSVEGSGIFDPEGFFGESATSLIGAFEAMDPEWIDKRIDGPAWLTGSSSDLGTINSDCMSLVQAIYNNPTAENQQALITFFEEWDAMEAENPTGEQLIIDDDQYSRIRWGLESAEPEDVQAVITRSDEGGQSWEPLVVEDYYTYYLSATSESSAMVVVYVGDYMYQTDVSIETDTEDPQVVVGECGPSPYMELDEL